MIRKSEFIEGYGLPVQLTLYGAGPENINLCATVKMVLIP